MLKQAHQITTKGPQRTFEDFGFLYTKQIAIRAQISTLFAVSSYGFA